jgi:DNA-binding Lrp family transcriptional regulator
MEGDQTKQADKEQEVIGILGGGEIGKELLQVFVKMNLVWVKYVADIDEDAPAMKLAQEEEVDTTTDIMEVINDPEIDLIIEVTGAEGVLATVRENKREDTGVITGETAYLVYNIVEEYKIFQQQLCEEVIEHLSSVYSEIEVDSQNIDDLLTQIKKVTKNLNMLALNASIEAARAGEEGQGFSVVADEVKELSEESGRLVGNIDEINEDVAGLNNRIGEVISKIKEEGIEGS